MDHAHKNPILARLFGVFLRLGITSLGGQAMVPYIRKMAVEQRQWLDDEPLQGGPKGHWIFGSIFSASSTEVHLSGLTPYTSPLFLNAQFMGFQGIGHGNANDKPIS
jgi:hypothetical protein